MLEFFDKVIRLGVERPKSPKSVLAARKYFYVTTALPNSHRGYSVHRMTSAVSGVVVIVVPVAVAVVCRFWRGGLDRGEQFQYMSEVTTIL